MIATRSIGKLRELVPILGQHGIGAMTLVDVGLPESPEEDHLEVFETFEDNALAKARYFAAQLRGHIVVADDSGLEVDALQGRPGVWSKRWSGRTDLQGSALDDANTALLLRELARVGAHSPKERAARYRCAMAAVSIGDQPIDVVTVGACVGHILDAPRGAEGFGYDPVFWSADLGESFGMVSRERKAAVSHRARALDALLPHLTSAFGG